MGRGACRHTRSAIADDGGRIRERQPETSAHLSGESDGNRTAVEREPTASPCPLSRCNPDGTEPGANRRLRQGERAAGRSVFRGGKSEGKASGQGKRSFANRPVPSLFHEYDLRKRPREIPSAVTISCCKRKNKRPLRRTIAAIYGLRTSTSRLNPAEDETSGSSRW